nr:hypothetical protein [Tanacetum cinerariifolium]
MPITSVEDKAQRRLEVKEMCTLIMGIPNEDQLKFNSIKDVKQLLEAIEKRFALVSCYCLGRYDWSDQAKEGPNYALMAFTSSSSDSKDKGVIDRRCSRHVTGNMSYLTDYEKIDGGYVAFRGNPKGGKITGKGKFDVKADEGFFVGYSLNSKTFRVFNSRKRIVEENFHIRFSENTPNVHSLMVLQSSHDDGFNPSSDDGKKVDEDPSKGSKCNDQEKEYNVNRTNNINAASTNGVNDVGENISSKLPFDPDMLVLEDISTFNFSRFKDPGILDRVYKVEKALYGLHQAHRAWHKGDILLVQVYVDDIIFGSTKKELCNEFEKMMHKKFQMSSMGELTFFLGLQVKQKNDGIFISQDKYAAEIFKKFGFTKVKNARTPMETQKPLLKDEDGEEVDVHMYRSMIGSLMYLTSLSHDIMFVVCSCARYQVNLKVSHLHAVKRIFRYLKRQPKLGLWYLKDSSFDLVAYTDSDYAGASLDRKSTIGEKPTESEGFKQIVDFLSAHTLRYALTVNPTIYDSCIERFWSTAMAKTINGEAKIHAYVDGKEIIITKSSVRRDLRLADEEGDRLVRAATTASSLEAEQDSGNIYKTQSKATPNEASSPGTTSGGGLRCQDTIGDTIAQTKFENVSKLSNDSLLARGNTLQSDEDIIKLNELMELCTNLQSRVIDLEKTKTTQELEIASLKRSEEVFVEKEVANKEVNDEVQKVVKEVVEDTNTAKLIVDAAQVSVAGEVNVASIATAVSAAATIKTEEITMAQAIVEIKTSKPKAKRIVLQEPSESTTTTTKKISLKQSQDKGKGIMDDVQAKIDVDYQMAKGLQAEEQQELTDAEKATLFMQFLAKRKKLFAAKRVEEKRNKPPTQAQKRKIMCTYLKNMEGYTLKQLKSFEFDKIQEMFDKAFKRVNTFKDFRTELVQGQDKEKRVGEELTQESAKKQKANDDKEIAELKQLMKIIPDEEEVAIDDIPLAVKSLGIVD